MKKIPWACLTQHVSLSEWPQSTLVELLGAKAPKAQHPTMTQSEGFCREGGREERNRWSPITFSFQKFISQPHNLTSVLQSQLIFTHAVFTVWRWWGRVTHKVFCSYKGQSQPHQKDGGVPTLLNVLFLFLSFLKNNINTQRSCFFKKEENVSITRESSEQHVSVRKTPQVTDFLQGDQQEMRARLC